MAGVYSNAIGDLKGKVHESPMCKSLHPPYSTMVSGMCLCVSDG